ncbi:TPA: hypothetical protein ACQ2HY_003313 [Klebsiella pneumoniae]
MDINEIILLDRIYNFYYGSKPVSTSFFQDDELIDLFIELADSKDVESIKEIRELRTDGNYMRLLCYDIKSTINRKSADLMSRFNREMLIEGVSREDFGDALLYCAEKGKGLFKFTCAMHNNEVKIDFFGGLTLCFKVNAVERFVVCHKQGYYTYSELNEVIDEILLKTIREIAKIWKTKNLL